MTDRTQVQQHLEEAADLENVARISYWQKLGNTAIFNAADELVKRHCEERGISTKLDRSIGFYHRGSLPKEK